MADDTPAVLPGNLIPGTKFNATVDGDGGYSMQSTPRTNGAEVTSTNPLPTDNPATTYQGTLALTAATSTTLTTGNVTMASNSVLPAPGTFKKLTVINEGPNPVYAFWLGGTASAAAGGELLAPLASDTVNLLGASAPPSFYSTSGTNLSFRN